MHIQHAQRFSRRRFLGGTLAGMAGLLGVPPPPPRPVAAEPPPETTRLRVGRLPASVAPHSSWPKRSYRARGSPRRNTSIYTAPHSLKRPPPARLTSARTSSGRPSPGWRLVPRSCSCRGPTSAASELFAHEQVRAVRDLKGKTMAVRRLGNTEHTFIASILAYVGAYPPDGGAHGSRTPLTPRHASSSRRGQLERVEAAERAQSTWVRHLLRSPVVLGLHVLVFVSTGARLALPHVYAIDRTSAR